MSGRGFSEAVKPLSLKVVLKAYEEVRHRDLKTASRRPNPPTYLLSLGCRGCSLRVLHKPRLFQRRKLLFGFGHDGQLGVGAFPEREEILVINTGAVAVMGRCLCPTHG